MATTRIANTHWEGDLDGEGSVSLDSSRIGTFPVSWPSRAEEPNGKTSPEELIAAAHGACFSMAFSARLGKNGTPPQALDTRVEVGFQPGTGITGIAINVRGRVEGIAPDRFAELARDAKDNCPVSQALAGTAITLEASLE